MKKLYIVGAGPGRREYMSEEAIAAVNKSDIILGYKVYGEIIQREFPGKTVWVNGMGKELERCEKAFKEAQKGAVVALVCSGDAGVYGMAAPALAMWNKYPDVDVELISGNTAALTGAALLGAPLNHDFAVISLSDLLTSWDLIKKRLECAAMGDFCIALYNVRSHGRPHYLKEACEIILKYKNEDTVCGYVRNIGRENTEAVITTLKKIKDMELDMFCTVFIGNEKTYCSMGRMITPRGYENKRI